MSDPLITFLSDFGREDWFVGVVHGVIHEHFPRARVIDLTHEIPPGHVFFADAETHAAEVIGGAGTRTYIVELKGKDWRPSTG